MKLFKKIAIEAMYLDNIVSRPNGKVEKVKTWGYSSQVTLIYIGQLPPEIF